MSKALLRQGFEEQAKGEKRRKGTCRTLSKFFFTLAKGMPWANAAHGEIFSLLSAPQNSAATYLIYEQFKQ